MKFDGYSEDDGKRVVVRDCTKDDQDINKCDDHQKYIGAIGTMCYCNADNCNGAERNVRLISTFSILVAVVFAMVWA